MSTDLEYTTQIEELNKSLELLNQTIANDTTKNQDLLDQQNALQELIQHEKDITMNHMNKLEKEKKTAQRDALLKKNSGDRLKHYNLIIIYLVLGLVAYIIIYMIEKNFTFIPLFIINVLKITVISVALIFCIQVLVTIQSRDPLNFDKLNLVKPRVYTQDEAQRAQEQAENEGDLTSSSSAQANVCSGNACCGPNTEWDEEKMLCVPIETNENFTTIQPNQPSHNYNIYT